MNKRTAFLINRKFSEYLLPTILTTAALSVTSVVDGVIVGNLLGKTALAAVGLSAPLIFGNNAIFSLFAVGGITCASTARGERDEDGANRFFSACLMMGVAVMVLYSLAVTVFAKPLCTALAGGDALLAEYTRTYITSLIWSGPFLIFALCSAQFWKLEGSPKASIRISIVANGVNLVFDFVMIRFLHMGIVGAGLSTTLGYMIGALLTLGYYRWSKRGFHFVRPAPWIFSYTRKIIGKGMYRSFTSLSSLVQNLVMNALIITAFGSDGLATLTICINALMIVNIFVGGASETLQPIAATLYGEKDIYGIRVVFRRAITRTLAMCIPLMVVYTLFPNLLGSLFGGTVDTTVLYTAIRLYTIYIPFYIIAQLLQALYNSTGHSKRSTLMSATEGLVLVNAYALLINSINSRALWLCYALASVTMLLIMVCIAAWTRRKNPALHGLLLLPAHKSYIPWETSVPADKEHAAQVSADVQAFCEKNGISHRTAYHIAVAAEEMIANTAFVNAGGKPVTMDVMVCVSEDELFLRIRDDAPVVNLLACSQDEELVHSSIDFLLKLAADASYSHQLGFNIVTISFSRQKMVL